MRLVSTDHATLTIALNAEDCLLLADACFAAADSADNGDRDLPQARRTEGAIYRGLRFAFEGYALVSHAQGLMRAEEYALLTLDLARRESGALPGNRAAGDTP